MTRQGDEVHFIHSYSPGSKEQSSAEVQRQVRSHAARAAHAKTRRQRLARYQAKQGSVHPRHQQHGDSHQNQDHGLQQSPPSEAFIKGGHDTSSSPFQILGSGRRDPFSSFARPLSPAEDFLLDYCEHPNLHRRSTGAPLTDDR